MQPLTDSAWSELLNIAQRYGVSTDAARAMLDAVHRGNGTMAQFNHPELGGYGQWMRGGMTMVGDMFNHGLKAMVDNLCNDLARLLERGNPYVMPAQQGGSSQWQGGGYQSGSWWPSELGMPTSSGAQNDMRYAYFAGPRRLVIDVGGSVTVYDTLQHQIGGVSQQQGGGTNLSFSSQLGNVDLAQLPVVSSNAPSRQEAPQAAQPAARSESEADVFAKIEKLAGLRQMGAISDQEFNAKKAELLARI